MNTNMKSYRNTYEESPEQLKELVRNGTSVKGQRPSSKPTRRALVSTHERHMKFLTEGPLPMKNIILPFPYPPSTVSVRDPTCHIIKLNDLRYDIRDPNTVLIVKAISPSYVYSTTVLVVEDDDGNVARLTLCNLEDTLVDPMVSEGDVLAIKQPCWVRLVDGGFHIRIDHPSDWLKLETDDSLVPEPWRKERELSSSKSAKEWKTAGDMLFLKKKFRAAMECYQHGLEASDNTADSIVNFRRKKCGVDIVLLRLDEAAHDLSMAVSSLPAAKNSTSKFSNPSAFEQWLHNGAADDQIEKDSLTIPKALLELASRIKFDLGIFQNEPKYDFATMMAYVGPLSLHLDCPTYISDTFVKQTENKGRGLFARKDFKRGDLIMLEKAFVLPGYFIQDRNSDCLLYNLENESASPRPGALLLKELIQKLRHNPSCRKAFFDLDAGSYPSTITADTAPKDIPVDVFHIEAIRQRNCFSAPLRSLDLLTTNQPTNSNPELRNGFWIQASYANHSCTPNSVRTFIGDIHILRATRDIPAGQEITHQYVAPEVDIAQRQEKFRGSWGFECDCELCSVEGKLSEEERGKRLELFEGLKGAVMKIGGHGANPPTNTAIKKIAKMTAKLEALYEVHAEAYATLPRLALVHPTLWLTEAYRGIKNLDKTIDYAVKLLRNFGIVVKVEGGGFEVVSETGLVNVEVVRALKYLNEAYLAKGEEEVAGMIMELARSWFVCIVGCEVGMEEFLRS